MNVIGLDIGTTTICGIAVDSTSGKILRSVTLNNDSFIDGKDFEKIQSPKLIIEKVERLANELADEFAPIGAVGITGQMHGIVYIDKNGCAVSSLYTWQDGSGNLDCGGKTYAQALEALTGCKAASGFGATTYFYHSRNSLVPESAVKFCTIHDCAAMVLTGKKEPLCHSSDAASFGLFDIKNCRFDKEKVEAAGLDYSMFPDVTADFEAVGEFRGVPVCVAIGDNQASFIGSVRDMEGCALVNIGTGGQISLLAPGNDVPKGMELRPLFADKNILVGCSLCGGRAFAALADFFSQCVEMATGKKPENIYRAMDKALEAEADGTLEVCTKLCGTRDEPNVRGSITNIGIDNFTPTQLMNGFLGGMVDELTELVLPLGCEFKSLVGSGNGIRKNIPLQKRFSDSFGTKMLIPKNCEEAAFGAVLTALVAAKEKPNISAAQQLIAYNL